MGKRRLGSKNVHHGRTPAAWISSILALIGFAILAVGFLSPSPSFPSVNVPVAVVGGVVIVLAPIVGGILNRVGLGQDA